jgi:hypothetical protein
LATSKPSKEDFDKVLDVPYYSQLTEVEVAGLDDEWKSRSAGLLCLKMVMDYWHFKSKSEVPGLVSLLHVAREQKAINSKHDWIHAGIVRTAEHFEFLAWRRKWSLSKDEEAFFKKEGLERGGLSLLEKQTHREGIMTLTNAIVADIPVIISVPKEFGNTNKSHLVVVTGIRKDAILGKYKGFYINDPYNAGPARRSGAERKDEFISQERFINHWNRRAIFVIPKGYRSIW